LIHQDYDPQGFNARQRFYGLRATRTIGGRGAFRGGRGDPLKNIGQFLWLWPTWNFQLFKSLANSRRQRVQRLVVFGSEADFSPPEELVNDFIVLAIKSHSLNVAQRFWYLVLRDVVLIDRKDATFPSWAEHVNPRFHGLKFFFAPRTPNVIFR